MTDSPSAIAAGPALDEALHGGQGVEAVRVEATAADHERVLDLAAQRELELGEPPAEGQRGVRHHREAEPVHLRSADSGRFGPPKMLSEPRTCFQ